MAAATNQAPATAVEQNFEQFEAFLAQTARQHASTAKEPFIERQLRRPMLELILAFKEEMDIKNSLYYFLIDKGLLRTYYLEVKGFDIHATPSATA